MTQARWAEQGAVEQALVGLRSAGQVSEGAATALRAALAPIERYPATAVINSFSPTPRMKWILSGWACELRVLPDGRRQIFTFAIPGDVVLARPVNAVNPCSVVALTKLDCIDVAQTMARMPEPQREEVARAMQSTLNSMQERRYEDITRLGRHSAVQRVADLLVELHDRLARVGLTDRDEFHLPLTQEHLADALGLSAVHVNRSLKILRTRNLATFRFGRVVNFNRAGLAELCHSVT